MSLSNALRNVVSVAALLAAGGLCQAGSITVGTADSVNGLPFETVTSGVYQQIYGSQDFGSQPLQITGVTFYGQNGSTITNATYNVNVSTVSAALGASPLYILGANNTQEFDSTLSGAVAGGEFTINFRQPFDYNPEAGNLLLQISVIGGPANPGGLGLYTMANGGSLFSRAYNVYDGPTNVTFADSTGLVTTFNTPSSPATAPEPGTLALFGLALVGGGLLMRCGQHRSARKTS